METEQKSVNELAADVAEQLERIVPLLSSLILNSEESTSMRLEHAAQDIGKVLGSARQAMQSSYGMD